MISRLVADLRFSAQGVDVKVAQLGWDTARREAAAEWDATFAASPLPLSPLLVKDHASLLRSRNRAFGDLPGLFGDSLPDGWGRLLVDRELAARGKSRSSITDLDRLSMVGQHGMGAFVYRPEEVADVENEIDLDWFENLAPELGSDTAAEDLEKMRTMAGGSHGARPKFVAQLSNDGKRLRDHRLPLENGWTHVLVKRRAANDEVGSIEAEAAYADMARAAGIDMMPVTVLQSSSGEPYFVTERFDRSGGDRLHMQTVAALLDVDFRSAVLDYTDLIKVVKVLTRDHRQTEEMFRRMVFNVLTHNRDDHLKNHAFLMNADGNWRLAPAYDVSFSNGPGGEHTLLVAGEGRNPTKAHFDRVAKVAGIKPARAAQLVTGVREAVSDWSTHAYARGVPTGLKSTLEAMLAERERVTLR